MNYYSRKYKQYKRANSRQRSSIIKDVKTALIDDITYPFLKVYYRLESLIVKKYRQYREWYAFKFNTVVYYEYFSRDCDMCESSGVRYALNQKDFDKAEDNMYQWAEGTCWMKPISKDEYLELSQYGDSRRDRVMEAYENGNGSNIYV